ncbi:MAG: phosphatidylglycerol lysyltransferase domain-containing protein [Ornithinimicrobium sp.]
MISDADATLAFVRAHGTASTAPLLALPDNQLLTLCSGAALAAVGVRSGTAVCLGGPVAERGREAEALEEFTAYCEQAGWVPALLGADTTQLDIATGAGYTSLKIGVEAFIDVADFSTAGKRRSNVRHSVSRAGRDGVSVLRYADSARSAQRTAQLGAVSSQWLLDKGGPELGFTLGRFDPQRLDDQEVYAALLHEGTEREQVVGFVTWLPYEQGRSAVLDLMRRAQECPPGVMEMLIVESLADFARRGRVSASLGGVPLANVADGPSGVAQHLLAWTYANGGTLYDARGLFRFKDKFDPRWEPMWLCYPRNGDLPRIALAAARAFLPPHAVRDMVLTKEGRAGLWGRLRGTWACVVQRFAELDRAQRQPSVSPWVRVPIAAAVVMSALLVAAVRTWESFALLPAFEQRYSWSAQYTLDGVWWRAITATVMTENAAAWVSLTATTVLLLAVLERMVGFWRAFAVYLFGAVWGYLGTTLFLWVASSLGWDLATTTLATTDYGPSGGTAAVGAAVVILMRHWAVTTVLFGGLLVGSALHHEVADVEHLISFGTVVLLAYLVGRARGRPVGADDTPAVSGHSAHVHP